MKLILLFALILFIGGSSASPRSSYGEECSRFQKCDRRAWLSCSDGLCDCSKPEEMHYDAEKQKCVTKSGERCKFGVEESGERGLVEISDCVPNSVCSEEGICVCDSKYHEIFNGTCEISKIVGESCSEEDKCSLFERLHCINATCSCKERTSVYSTTMGQCVGSLNQNCIGGQCLPGAECHQEDNKCVCDIDHYEDSSTKTCLRKKDIKEKCERNSECIRKGLLLLECSNGFCDCEEGSKLSKVKKFEYSIRPDYYRYRSYDFLILEMSKSVVEACAPSIVGRKCPDGYCSRNLECILPQYHRDIIFSNLIRQRSELDSSESTESPPSIFLDQLVYNETICECQNTYYASRDNSKCGRRMGHSCDGNDDCLNNLVCSSGSCQCSSSDHQLNDDDEYCLSRIGGMCKTNSDCIVNSFCKLVANSTVGYCHCKENYVDSGDGERCEGGYGTGCQYNDNNYCDKTAELVCKDKKCSCPDNFMYMYSATVRKCLGLIGAFCDPSARYPSPCVDNAECVQFNSKFRSRCNCKKGYKLNENFTCDEIADQEL